MPISASLPISGVSKNLYRFDQQDNAMHTKMRLYGMTSKNQWIVGLLSPVSSSAAALEHAGQ